MTLKAGDIVEFSKPFPDEVGLTYRIRAIEGEWLTIVAIIDLPYPPVQTIHQSEMKLATTEKE